MREFAPPDLDVALRVARKFRKGGCCGRKPEVTVLDLPALGLDAIDITFSSSRGQISPLTGWKAMCLWIYETFFGPFPEDEKRDPGEVLGEALVQKCEALIAASE